MQLSAGTAQLPVLQSRSPSQSALHPCQQDEQTEHAVFQARLQNKDSVPKNAPQADCD